MKILVLMDSFKGSLTSIEAGEAVKTGILSSGSDADVSVYPFADGGEGTLDAFLKADKGSRKIKVNVSDPLGRRIDAGYGVLSDNTAVIEIAQAAGLCLLSEVERNPLKTTTRGVGELIKHAINNGIRDFIIALGGSATNDCGIGMLKELGFKIFDNSGVPVYDGALGLSNAVSIDSSKILPFLNECSFVIACDVKNPLFGTQGASHVFAPQKGASFKDIEMMDAWFKNFSAITHDIYPDSDPNAEGAGAAGGLGFAFQAFLNGKMQPGTDVLICRTDIETEISKSDLIITGEGRMDEQTAMGKAPVRIANLAKKYDKPVIAITGCVGKGAKICHDAGIDAIFPILSHPMTSDEAMDPNTTRDNIIRTTCEIMRLVQISHLLDI